MTKVTERKVTLLCPHELLDIFPYPVSKSIRGLIKFIRDSLSLNDEKKVYFGILLQKYDDAKSEEEREYYLSKIQKLFNLQGLNESKVSKGTAKSEKVIESDKKAIKSKSDKNTESVNSADSDNSIKTENSEIEPQESRIDNTNENVQNVEGSSVENDNDDDDIDVKVPEELEI
jgi:competence protein ComGC